MITFPLADDVELEILSCVPWLTIGRLADTVKVGPVLVSYYRALDGRRRLEVVVLGLRRYLRIGGRP